MPFAVRIVALLGVLYLRPELLPGRPFDLSRKEHQSARLGKSPELTPFRVASYQITYLYISPRSIFLHTPPLFILTRTATDA